MFSRFFVVFFLFTAFSGAILAQDNAELVTLAKEDQASRMGQEIARTDDERRQRVFVLLAEGKVQSPQDKFNAALVLQHTGMSFCGDTLVSLSAENYLLAHRLFEQAMLAGIADAKYLYAASIDRYLSITEGRQRYGTNRIINQETGAEEFPPIDRSVSDEERAKYGVPPLAELLKAYPEQVKKTGGSE